LSRATGVAGRSWGSWWARSARGALGLLQLADALGWETTLTLLSEDAVEGVLAGLGWRGDRQLHLHQIGPRSVGVDTEGLHAILHSVGDVIDG